MNRSRTKTLMAALLVLAGLAAAQEIPNDDAVWEEFIGWFRTAPDVPNPMELYTAKLEEEGLPDPEIQRRMKTIIRLFAERTEGAEVFYDRTYSRPRTGDPSMDAPKVPSAFVVDAAKGLKPGAALDLGAGQGRNAVFLARQGWEVTAMDVSQAGLNAARANAAAAGVGIRTEKASYEGFDFGVGRWDLIAVIFAWAPVADPAFVSKLRASLRPGGVVLFEHFVATPERAYAPMVKAVKPNALKEYFADFEIVSYEETETTADWGGPGSRVVRMAARKKA